MIVKFTIVRNEAGGEAVAGPDHRVKAAVTAFKQKAAECEAQAKKLTGDSKKEQTTLAEGYHSMAKESQEIYDRLKNSEGAEEFSIEIKPYTKGQQIEARRQATTIGDGEKTLFDNDTYSIHLVMASTGRPEAEVLDWSPGKFNAVLSEAIETSEPDPRRLSFLLSSPAGSAITEASAATK